MLEEAKKHAYNEKQFEVIFSAIEKISAKKIVKALIILFLISSNAFECEFESQSEESKRFVLTFTKTAWDDIKDKTNQSFIAIKKEIVEKSPNKLLKDLNLPATLKQKAEKVQNLIKLTKWQDIKKVYDTITNQKTFTIDFTA